MKYTENILDELKGLLGAERLSFQDEDLDAHAYDAWPVAAKWKLQGKAPYRPQVIVRPVLEAEVSRLLAWASKRGVPVTPWGLGSSVTGAPLPMQGGVLLDLSGLHRILSLDERNLLVRAEAGLLGSELESFLNRKGYTLNHSPQSLDRSTLGGWVSTRAMGQFSSRYGGIEDLALGFRVVLPNGEVMETTRAPRAAVGPDLRHLFMGAEGTLGVVTAVTLKIFPLPEQRLFEALTFPGVRQGVEAMRSLMRAGLRPFLVRFYDLDEARHVMRGSGKTLDSFHAPVLFLGFEGLESVARAEHAAGLQICERYGAAPLGPAPVEAWMQRRFDFSAVEKILARPGGLAETIEIAHFWDAIYPTYLELKQGLAPLADEVLAHFSHVYPQGASLYMILTGSAADDAQAEQRLLKIWQTAMGICLAKGAAISHHHGVGIARLPYLAAQLQSQAPVLQRIKKALDPQGILNPGKLGLPGPKP